MDYHLLFLTSIFILSSISMAEIRKLMPMCANSCHVSANVNSRNCFCDSKCSLIYNDCCLDAPYRTIRMALQRRHLNRCVFVHGENRHFWMVNSCKYEWTGHEHIKEKCSETTVVSSESSDLIGAVPVTNPTDGVTYKNYYCAMCNDDSTEDLVEWRIKAICSNVNVTQAEVLQNLTFIEEKQQWGVWKWNKDKELDFHECYLLFQKPANISKGIRTCMSGIISSCPKSWRSIATRRLCKSYLDPVKWNDGFVYRNMDCALCHNRTIENFQCVYDVAISSNAVMLFRAMKVDMSCSGQWL